MIDERLNFRSHVEYVVRKSSKYISVLYKVRKFMPLKVFVQVYHTIIYPHLTFCITVWGGSYRSILKPAIVLLNRILRAIYGAEFNASFFPIYQHLKL